MINKIAVALAIGASLFGGSAFAQTYVGPVPQSAVGAPNGVMPLAGGFAPIANIPTGTTGSTVALGNDTRIVNAVPNSAIGTSVAPLVSGVVPIGNIPVGTTAGTVVAGNDSRLSGAVAAATYANNLTAAGTTQAGGTTISSSDNTFTTVPAGSGAVLAIISGQPVIIIRNSGANNLLVYPQSGGAITVNGTTLAANAPVAVSSGSYGTFKLNGVNWVGS